MTPTENKSSRKTRKQINPSQKKQVSGTALIVVDVQTDFLPGGALGAIKNANEVVAPLVKLTDEAGFIVATRDFHPDNHCSFVEQGGQWPRHCVAGDEPQTMKEYLQGSGTDIHPAIAKFADVIVSKGTDANVEAYSGFDGTDLAEQLRARSIETVLIGGLATDYCVKATAIDCAKEGFKTIVVKEACRAVDESDGNRAYAEMFHAGVKFREES